MFHHGFMLLGLTGISVPIIIHLLNKRRFERVVWAAMRFLRISVEQNQRRIRLEDILLLILRCWIVALLALALARPAIRQGSDWWWIIIVFAGLLQTVAEIVIHLTIEAPRTRLEAELGSAAVIAVLCFLVGLFLYNRPATGGGILGDTSVTAVLVIDNSYSMSATNGTESRFDKARKVAEEVVDSLPAGSKVSTMLASDIQHWAIPEPTNDLNNVRETIRQARIFDRGTSLLPAFDAAAKSLDGQPTLHKEIFFITDTQEVGWRNLPDICKLLQEARDKNSIRTHVVLVGEPEEGNLAVTGLQLSSEMCIAGQPLRFEATVTNFGKEEKKATVKLSVNDEPPMEQGTIEAIPPGGSKSTSLFANFPDPGFHAITARLAEETADRVPADNARTIVVHAVKQVSVLLVDGNIGVEERDSETFFLRNALQPVPRPEREGYYIQVKVVPPNRLDQEQWETFDVIALANVGELSSQAVPALEYFLRQGKGLMIFTGSNTVPDFYNKNLLEQRHILPAAIGAPAGDATQTDKFIGLQDKDYIHPIVSVWADGANGRLSTMRFYKWSELKLDERVPAANEDAGPARVVLNFSDGKPFMVERPWGMGGLGRVVLFGSSASTSWNHMGTHPNFVPLIIRTLGAIVQQQDQHLTVRVGGKFTHLFKEDALGRDVLITPPGQPKDKPSTESRRIEMANYVPTLSYDQTNFAGSYELKIGGDQTPTLRFAAQADSAESEMRDIRPDQIETLKTVCAVHRDNIKLDVKGELERERMGTELWMYLAVAALVLATAETLLAHWFSQSK